VTQLLSVDWLIIRLHDSRKEMDEQNDLERLLSQGKTKRREAEASQQRAARRAEADREAARVALDRTLAAIQADLSDEIRWFLQRAPKTIFRFPRCRFGGRGFWKLTGLGAQTSVGIALIPVGDLVWWQYVVIRPNVGKYGGGKDRLDIHGSAPQTAIDDVTRDAVLAGMAEQLGGRP
jgi:hypothetical protein